MSEKSAEPPKELTDEEKKAAKRKEIEEKVAALKLQQKKEADQKTMYFGEHPGITCDGCGTVPVVGYRYRCKACPNHDVCESCYDSWAGGKMSKKKNHALKCPRKACGSVRDCVSRI